MRRKVSTWIWGMVVLGFLAWMAMPAIGQWAAITTNKISQADTTKPIALETDGDGVKIGTPTTPGTAMSQLVIYTASLNPTAAAALTGNLVSASFNQTFTVTGLGVTDKVFVNGPAPTANCPPASVRVSAANTLQITFTQQTSAVCTPATGVYTIFAVRS